MITTQTMNSSRVNYSTVDPTIGRNPHPIDPNDTIATVERAVPSHAHLVQATLGSSRGETGRYNGGEGRI